MPEFSRDGITVGLFIAKRGNTHVAGHAALDNQRNNLIALCGNTLYLMTNSPRDGRAFVKHTFSSTSDVARIAHMQVSNCEMIAWEKRARCVKCNSSGRCTCTYDSGIPQHPLDFGVWAENVAGWNGEWSGFCGGRSCAGAVAVEVDLRVVTDWCESVREGRSHA